jgi:hypothetical protein
VALPGVLAIGIGANRLYRARTGEQTSRWMLTEEEASEIGGALGRMMARRLPEGLVTGENGDLLVIAGTAAGYLLRNVLELDEATYAAAQAEAARLLDEGAEPRGPVAPPAPPAADVDQAPAPAAPQAAVVMGATVLGAEDVGAV